MRDTQRRTRKESWKHKGVSPWRPLRRPDWRRPHSSRYRARAADALLSGSITSAAGEKTGRGDGFRQGRRRGPSPPPSTPDDSGNYYFPPLPTGKYRVWAQALTILRPPRARSISPAAKHPGFSRSARLRISSGQLPGDLVIASLPRRGRRTTPA